jgi:hypothetical protein
LDPEREVLLPLIFYIDGAATGQFANLPVTPLKFTFGIFNQDARSQQHMWQTLGYVPVVLEDQSLGCRRFYESGHVDSIFTVLAPGEGNVGMSKSVLLQDYHEILSKIMEGMVKIQQGGIIWDFMYGQKVHRNIKFVPYVHFIKCDTKEADKLVGKYGSRGPNVKQICRYCCCPTDKSDNTRVNYPHKTLNMIKDLIQNSNQEGLKAISQHPLGNAWYPLNFGTHSNEGVHRACPIEMLHALLLGIFKYVCDMFFEQIGGSSQLSMGINSLTSLYGELLSHHSDHDMPRLKFSNGIQERKLMANEYPGMLLLLAITMNSSEGRKMLGGRTVGTLLEVGGLDDWMHYAGINVTHVGTLA